MAELALAARAVLQFWFGDGDDAQVLSRNGARWWRRDARLDAEIAERFGTLRENATRGELDGWLATAHGRLAAIVLIDQFSRNLLRGEARAFEHDATARRWCTQGLDAGVDRELRPVERVFFYLPLEHSEALDDQERSVALFTQLRDAAPAALRAAFDNFLDFARRHRDVIARFGRFPHRNAALGRTSTPDEIAFLRQPGSSF